MYVLYNATLCPYWNEIWWTVVLQLKSQWTQNRIFICFNHLSYMIINIVINAILSLTEISPRFREKFIYFLQSHSVWIVAEGGGGFTGCLTESVVSAVAPSWFMRHVTERMEQCSELMLQIFYKNIGWSLEKNCTGPCLESILFKACHLMEKQII